MTSTWIAIGAYTIVAAMLKVTLGYVFGREGNKAFEASMALMWPFALIACLVFATALVLIKSMEIPGALGASVRKHSGG